MKYLMFNRLLLISFIVLNVFIAKISLGQIASLEPSNPSPNELITLTYNSNEGNRALANYDETVYLHTGVITQNSIDGGDWKHVIGNWGEDDKRVRMTSIGEGLHEL